MIIRDNRALRLLLVVVLFAFSVNTQLKASHNIQGQIANYAGDSTAYLAMMYGGYQYVVDSTAIDGGSFEFNTTLTLQSGMYLIVLPPETSFFVLVDANEAEVRLEADFNDISGTIAFENSPDNTIYYEYLRFFENKIAVLDSVKRAYDAQVGEPDKLAILNDMQSLKQEITDYQTNVVETYPDTYTAAMIRCEITVEPPAYTGPPEGMQLAQYTFYKQHYFDNIDLTDERLVRAPKRIIVDKVEFYLDNVVLQHPDSIIAGIDLILSKSMASDVSYRFFLTHLFNRYKDSPNVGMDAVYVHIAQEYIATGKAPWIEDDEKNAVLSAIASVAPTLIGKTAPNFTVQRADDSDISLYDIEAPYTVLFFWAPNCSHCQKSMPALKDFYNKYSQSGVEVFAVCTKFSTQEPACWTYLEEGEMMDWINASDKRNGSSGVLTTYNIRNTPRIFVLSQDKTIMAKDIAVEQLDDIMTRLMQQ